MAVWQIMEGGKPTGEFFDDGGAAQPGEDGFATDAVAAAVKAEGSTADWFNYVGVSPSVAAAQSEGTTA